MIISSYTRSKDGLTVYDDDGNYQTLKPTDYELPRILTALSHLTATGEAVKIDLSKFQIFKALQEVAPEATIIAEEATGISLRYDDLNLVIRNASRLEHHLRMAHGDPKKISAIRAFLANCAMSKRSHSVDELLDFVSANDLPITDDGMILGWKYVSKNKNLNKDRTGVDYLDRYSQKFDNSVGRIVWMRPEDVNPNRREVCSTGLHVCSRRYLASFSDDATILVKVHPAHFISIPIDYNNTKARTCAYLVLDDETFDKSPKDVSHFLDFPAAVHIDGKTLAIGAEVSPRHADLIAKMRFLNKVLPDPVDTKAENLNPQKAEIEPIAPPENAIWHSFDDLANFTGKSKATIRGAASNSKWSKRLSASGLIETIPDSVFRQKHIDGWFSIDALKQKFGYTQQKLVGAARHGAWPQRRTNDGVRLMKPPAGYGASTSVVPAPATSLGATKRTASDRWYTFVAISNRTGKTTNAVRAAASERHWEKRTNDAGLTETLPDVDFYEKYLAGWYNFDELSAKFGVNPVDIAKIAVAENWPTRRSDIEIHFIKPPADYNPGQREINA